MINEYGVFETNPLQKPLQAEDIPEEILWDELKKTDKIELVRLRLLSDYGFPLWDISYIWINVNGVQKTLIGFPEDQLPKRGLKSYLYSVVKRDKRGIFINGLFDNGNYSKLQ